MNKMSYSQAIRKIAIGYVFIFLDINIGTIDIMPNWLGYIFFYQSIPSIAEYEKSAKLLKPIITVLGTYEMIYWIFKILDFNIDIYILDIIISALKLYLDFQFITNIADIAFSHQYPDSQKLYILRNIQTILITLIVLTIYWNKLNTGSIVYIILSFFITIWICISLFQYAKYERNLSNIDLMSVK